MSTTVSAAYDKTADAHNVIKSISERQNFCLKDINIITQDKDSSDSQHIQTLVGTQHRHDRQDDESEDASAPEASGETRSAGSRIGDVLANMMIGARALVMPSIGPILAIGPVGSILAGAGPEAMTSALPIVISSLGVSRDDAELYAEAIRRGATLVLLRAEGADAVTAADVFKSYHPIDMPLRAEQWRSEGWDPASSPNAVPLQELAAALGLDTTPLPDDAPEQTPDAAPHSQSDRALKAAARKRGKSKEDHANGSRDSSLDDDFREHLRANPPPAGGAPSFEDHRDAYAFGVWLGRLDRFEKMKWEQTQTEAHKLWAEQHHERGETWEEIKDRVQYAWHKVKASTYKASL